MTWKHLFMKMNHQAAMTVASWMTLKKKNASAAVTEVLASLGQRPIITSEYLVRSIADNDQPCIIQFMEANLSYQSATEHKWGFLCHLIPFGRSRPLKGCAI